MDEFVVQIALMIAALLELAVVLVISAGAVVALLGIAKMVRSGPRGAAALRNIWLKFAAWILLALEFALGADIVRTVMEPNWADIGMLAAIGAIRTVLGIFLARDLEDIREEGDQPPNERG